MGIIYLLSDTQEAGTEKLPVIEIEFLKIDAEPKNYDFLLFTSKNGVKALDVSPKEWRKIPALAIGSATALEIKKRGGNVFYTAKSFYGDDFANELCNLLPPRSKILYIRAQKLISQINIILKKCGFQVEEVIGYLTKCKECKNLKKPEENSFIVFSSPSTIKCFLKCFKWDKSYKAIAIGKKTASFLPSYIEYFILPTPSFKGCAKIIEKFYGNGKSLLSK